MFNVVTIKEVKIKLGDWCKALRNQENLTQQELADELALSRITISNLEKGKNFTIDTLLKILQYFDQLNKLSDFISNDINTNKSLY